ncbi:hypothetical protein NliqN6_5033 [Naganishia liquefaciens]|uniref:60S ribosomal protein L29 n=1 Tax=Naganishia liquefaciens TaxID=104408 RepID=A0A8H3YII9_9TREE|nr:hypothetical protein NliqN6_5033 [Naganishia liquefaciens]
MVIWVFDETISSWHRRRSAHRNGITKPKGNKYASMKGVDPKFRRNARFAAQGSQKAVREARAAKAE